MKNSYYLKKAVFLKIILFAGFLYLNQFIQAQDTQQESTVQDTIVTESRPELITSSEITNKLPEATSDIRSIHKTLVPDSVLLEESTKLDTFLLNFELFQKELAESDTGKTDQTKLENHLYLWNSEKSKLSGIQGNLNSIKDKLNEQKESIDEILNVWQLSKEAMTKEEDLPENILQMVNNFLKNAGYIKDTINQKNEVVFTQLERVTSTNIIIDEHLSDIQIKLKMVTGISLTTKGPSLFKVIFGQTEKEKLVGNMTSNLKRNFIPVSDFVSNNITRVIIHLLIFIFLLVTLIVVRKNLNFSKYRKMDKHLISDALTLLTRPLAISLLITLILTFFIYSDPPIAFKVITFVLLLIPIMILLPALTIKEMNIYIYSLGFIFLLMNIMDLTIYGSLLDNLIRIVIALILLFGLSKLLRTEILNKIFFREFSKKLFNGFFILLSILLIISILAIVVGYYLFGEFIIDGVIWSLYCFLLFYAGYNVAAGFTELLIHSGSLQRFNVIQKYHDQISKWLISALYLATILFLFYVILLIFEIKEPVIKVVISIWEFGFIIGNFNFSLGNVIIFFFTLWVAILISRITRAVLEEDVLNKMKLKRGVPRTISMMVRYTLITIGFLVAVAAAGMELKNLTIIFGALGVGIGFGLQDIINNFISGLILLFERPIQIGDTIQVGELWGNVKQIGIRSSVIRTFSGSEVIVPNGMLISREVTNWTLSDQKRRLEIEVGVAYGTDMENVLEILKKCASDHEQVLDDPAPSAWFTGFGESSLDFKLVFWFGSFDGGLAVKSEVAVTVNKALKEAGITIPFPQHDLYIKEPSKQDPVKKKIPVSKSKPPEGRA